MISFLNQKIPIFSPYSKIKFIWDIFIFIAYSFYSLYIPFEIGFDIFIPEYINYLIGLLILLNIFFKLSTGIIYSGEIVMSRNKIAKQYLQKYFYSDLISITVVIYHYLEMIKHFQSFNFIKLLFLVKFIECHDILEKIIDNFELNQKYENKINLLELLSTCIMISHLFACAWHYVGTSPRNHAKNWLLKAEIERDSVLIRYLYSYYWTSVTILTVGYGDITPTNVDEVMLSTVAVMIGCYVYAFNMNSIGLITQEIHKKNTIYK